jgi:hypothetical protein
MSQVLLLLGLCTDKHGFSQMSSDKICPHYTMDEKVNNVVKLVSHDKFLISYTGGNQCQQRPLGQLNSE